MIMRDLKPWEEEYYTMKERYDEATLRVQLSLKLYSYAQQFPQDFFTRTVGETEEEQEDTAMEDILVGGQFKLAPRVTEDGVYFPM